MASPVARRGAPVAVVAVLQESQVQKVDHRDHLNHRDHLITSHRMIRRTRRRILQESPVSLERVEAVKRGKKEVTAGKNQKNSPLKIRKISRSPVRAMHRPATRQKTQKRLLEKVQRDLENLLIKVEILKKNREMMARTLPTPTASRKEKRGQKIRTPAKSRKPQRMAIRQRDQTKNPTNLHRLLKKSKENRGNRHRRILAKENLERILPNQESAKRRLAQRLETAGAVLVRLFQTMIRKASKATRRNFRIRILNTHATLRILRLSILRIPWSKGVRMF